MSTIDPKKLDYSKMLCNVIELPSRKSPLEAFELLQKHKEFHVPLLNPHLPKTKVLIYVALIYDKGSPLHDAYRDLNKRKVVAADLSLFTREEGGKFNPKVEDMFRCEIPEINSMIIRYIMMSKSVLFQRYCVYSEAYFNASVKFLAGQIKIDEFNKISKELELCESELLAEDNKLHDDFTQYYFEDRLELRPEDIAERLKKGEEPVVLPEGVH